MDATIHNATFPVTIPESEIKLFKRIALKMGWNVGKRKKTGMEEALEDIKAGRVYPIDDIDEYFRKFGVK